MLWQRVITALVLIPLVLWLVLFADSTIFTLAMMVVISIAAYEWGMLSGLSGGQKFIYAGLMLLLMFAIRQYLPSTNYLWLLLAVSAVWLALTIKLIFQKVPVEPVSVIPF